MVQLSISKQSIKNAIEYFMTLQVESPEQIGLFFFFKMVGINSYDYKSFPKVSEIPIELKKQYLLYLYKLSGVFDSNTEAPKRRTCLFPFSINENIKQSDFYNGGSNFSNLISRIRDTVDNTLIDEDRFLVKDSLDSNNIKLRRDYINFMREYYLKGQKISLIHFSSWFYRFHKFECPASWLSNKNEKNINAFNRVCTKELQRELHLSNEEIQGLFYENTHKIDYSGTTITGKELRGLLSFASGNNPEINNLGKGRNTFMSKGDIVPLEKTKKLSQATGKNLSEDELYNLLLTRQQLILYGAPGTGKSYTANKLRTRFNNSKMIQFHPSMSYEQFIGGFSIGDDNRIISKPGVFFEFCELAKSNPQKKYLFIIDEVNRGNMSKIFGETILALDREYKVNLSEPILLDGIKQSDFSIPLNVYIIGTMNSADRSIALVDYALRRRFAFVRFYPNYELIREKSNCELLDGIDISVLFKDINAKLFSALKSEDLLLGHSYFIPQWALDADGKIKWTNDILMDVFNFSILPIIEEYTYANINLLHTILGNKLANRLADPTEFIEAIKENYKVI